MWTLAIVAGSAALIEITAVTAEPAIQSPHFAGPAADSISVLEFGITEVDQLAIAAGRYLWVSGPRQGIAVIDLLTGSGAQIGRAGAGPGEYRIVSHVFGCESTGGWVDDQLQRVTWMGPAGKGELRSIQLPSGLLSRAKTQSAWCEGDSLWIAVERQGAPASGTRVDSLAVFRVVRSTLDVDTVAKFQGSKRRLRSKGALRTSLRLPYQSPPLLVRTSGQLIVLGRSVDTVWTLVGRPRRSAPIVGDGPSRALASRHLPVVRDSISKWYEAEMESQRYEPELRREFRTVITQLLSELDLPGTLPVVRLASAPPSGTGEIIVVENDYPGSRRTCLATLALSGLLKRVLCRTWLDRTVGAIQAAVDGVWLAQWNEQGAWVMRIPMPLSR